MSVTGDPSITEEPAVAEPVRILEEPDGTGNEPVRSADDQIVSDDRMSTGEVRHRAVTGAVVDTLRAIGVRLVTVLGAIVTARLLAPYDFGLVAIGMTVFAFGSLLDDGGIGTALIRRPEPPTRAELQALVAFQFGVEVLLVVGIGLVMLPFGLLGRVTTVIVASLPLNAFCAPASILYERRLDYRPMAIAEIAQATVYYVWAIPAIIIGWGVYGLATGYVVSALAQTVLLLIFLPEGRVMPVPSWQKVRPLLGFGLRFQAASLLHMIRDQGVNIVLAACGGVAVLGLWSVAWRIIQIPVALLAALWRVSFPGMSKLIAAKEDLGGTVERVIALTAIGTAVLVVPLSASAAAWVHVFIGARWDDAASAVPPACFAIMFGVPISVALSGYLWGMGNASVPMRATAVGIPATLLLLLALLPFLGVQAAGVAYIASALVESLFFVYASRRTISFRVGARLGVPVALAVVSASAGWLVEDRIGPNILGGLSSAVVAVSLFLASLAIARRGDLLDAWNLAARGFRGALANRATT